MCAQTRKVPDYVIVDKCNHGRTGGTFYFSFKYDKVGFIRKIKG